MVPAKVPYQLVSFDCMSPQLVILLASPQSADFLIVFSFLVSTSSSSPLTLTTVAVFLLTERSSTRAPLLVRASLPGAAFFLSSLSSSSSDLDLPPALHKSLTRYWVVFPLSSLTATADDPSRCITTVPRPSGVLTLLPASYCSPRFSIFCSAKCFTAGRTLLGSPSSSIAMSTAGSLAMPEPVRSVARIATSSARSSALGGPMSPIGGAMSSAIST